jgi:formylglycine-generating enzyme required for sulfatase activity
VTRNAGAEYVIPSENEWYKAAYYDASTGTYWTFPTQSNTAPSNVLSATGTNNANYSGGKSYTDPTNFLTPVGSFADSPGPYGTYDMGGDVWQWNEAIIGDQRGLRGGYFGSYSYVDLASSQRSGFVPTHLGNDEGFRVAEVPEPGSITLLIAGAVAGFICWRRWR